MKKLLSLILVLALLLNASAALAELPVIGGGLPNLGGLPAILAPLPDPAESLGSVGRAYQSGYDYNGAQYDLYLYAKPEPAEFFIAAYTQAAEDAGYQVPPARSWATTRCISSAATFRPFCCMIIRAT